MTAIMDQRPPPKEVFHFRLSHFLREQLQAAALHNSRTVTGEIEARLLRSFDLDHTRSALREVLTEMNKRKSRRSRRKVTTHHAHA